MKKTIHALGIILGIFSVVSFFQRVFDVGIFKIAHEMIEYYRTVAYFFFDMPARLFGLHFPAVLMDIWTLSFVGAGAYSKTANIERARFFRRFLKLTKPRYWKAMLFVIWGFSGVGLWVLLAAVSPSTYVDAFHEEPLDLSKGAAVNAFYIFGGALVFFVLNAFAPSV